MMIEASWVTIKHRIWMLAGAAAEVVDDVLGAAEVVAEPFSWTSSERSFISTVKGLSVGEGVDAAVSSTDT